ncbi:Uncharacterised protein [Candidatus Venteria ishoeyi]|uniref:Uncharacterized protein n=1 Tax=Candidatus Venteria ishoeyi TaxID=1899563 RepID=A0A1H6FAD9_9GAMM|nr:Uncharacterised protein [Candidatus Venteria ishoeyi]
MSIVIKPASTEDFFKRATEIAEALTRLCQYCPLKKWLLSSLMRLIY